MLANMPPEERDKFFAKLSDEEAERLRWDWRFKARPSQLPPEGWWTTWMILAGRGFGKALSLDTPIPTPGGWVTMGEQLMDSDDRPLSEWSTAGLERGIASSHFDFDRKLEAKRILRERYSAPDRRLARFILVFAAIAAAAGVVTAIPFLLALFK